MLLVLTATPREAAPLVAALRAPTEVTVHGVAATDGRLGGVRVRLAVGGFARASTAFSLSRLLLDRPDAVLQVGVGGALPGGPPLGQVALATEDVYADLGAETNDGWLPAQALGFSLTPGRSDPVFDTFPCHAAATAAAAGVIGAPTGRFITVETVTASAPRAAQLAHRHRALIESMEGAAAAHACALDGVPFVQLRAASNLVGPRDPAGWRLDEAIAAAAAAAEQVAATVVEAALT